MFSSLLNYNGAGKVHEMWLISEHSCMPLGLWLCPNWTTFCITYDSCDLVDERWLLKQPLLLMSCSHVWNLHRQRGSGLCSWSRLLFYYQVSVPSNVVASRKNRVSQVLHISHPDILAHYRWCHLYFLLNVEQCQSKENISEYFPAHYTLSASWVHASQWSRGISTADHKAYGIRKTADGE